MTSVELLAEAPGWLSYDLPTSCSASLSRADIAARGRSGSPCASPASDLEIDIAARGGHKAEFEDWRWANVSELPSLTVAFQAAGLPRRRARVPPNWWVAASSAAAIADARKSVSI